MSEESEAEDRQGMIVAARETLKRLGAEHECVVQKLAREPAPQEGGDRRPLRPYSDPPTPAEWETLRPLLWSLCRIGATIGRPGARADITEGTIPELLVHLPRAERQIRAYDDRASSVARRLPGQATRLGVELLGLIASAETMIRAVGGAGTHRQKEKLANVAALHLAGIREMLSDAVAEVWQLADRPLAEPLEVLARALKARSNLAALRAEAHQLRAQVKTLEGALKAKGGDPAEVLAEEEELQAQVREEMDDAGW